MVIKSNVPVSQKSLLQIWILENKESINEKIEQSLVDTADFIRKQRKLPAVEQKHFSGDVIFITGLVMDFGDYWKVYRHYVRKDVFDGIKEGDFVVLGGQLFYGDADPVKGKPVLGGSIISEEIVGTVSKEVIAEQRKYMDDYAKNQGGQAAQAAQVKRGQVIGK